MIGILMTGTKPEDNNTTMELSELENNLYGRFKKEKAIEVNNLSDKEKGALGKLACKSFVVKTKVPCGHSVGERMDWTIVKSDELTSQEKEAVKLFRKYPKINNRIITERDIFKEHQISSPFLNTLLTMELKRDGSNLRLIHLKDDRFGVLSRNQYAADNFIRRVETVIKREPDKYESILKYAKEFSSIIFVELFGQGNSPAGFDRDVPISIEVFDVSSAGIWTPRKSYEKILPTVPVIEIIEPATEEEYKEAVAKCLKYCHDNGREGVVIKTSHSTLGRIMTKEKVPEALEQPKKQHKTPTPQLPVLEISEIQGAINKVHTEIGDKIWETETAMPLVARAIKEECKKHERSAPRSMYRFYLEYLDHIEQLGVKK